jgi:thiol:disulfide interchange protein
VTPLHRLASIQHPEFIGVAAVWMLFGYFVWATMNWHNTSETNNHGGAILFAILTGIVAAASSIAAIWFYEDQVIAERGPKSKQELHETIERLKRVVFDLTGEWPVDCETEVPKCTGMSSFLGSAPLAPPSSDA